MLMGRAKANISSCSQTVSLSPAFCRSSFLECALQPKIAKINKTPYFGSSGSYVDTTKKLDNSACCDRQHANGDLEPFS